MVSYAENIFTRIPNTIIAYLPVYELKSWLNTYSNEIDDIESDMQMIAHKILVS